MRVLTLSDTHNQHKNLEIPTNGYSIVVHTGDFSNSGSEEEVDDFLLWYSELPCKCKVLVAGNHDWFAYTNPDEFKAKCKLLDIIYLCDSEVVINGVKFYGTPYVPRFYDWAFMEDELMLVHRYSLIPEDTNVLLTHGPALWIKDEVRRGHVGSGALTQRLPDLTKLTHHIFGHIHEDVGRVNIEGVTHINASCVFDEPQGNSKIISIKNKS